MATTNPHETANRLRKASRILAVLDDAWRELWDRNLAPVSTSPLAAGLIADLVGDAPSVAHPWHDAETDRDVVSNGKALLTWDGCAYATCPDPEYPPHKVSPLLEPCGELGETTLGALIDWVAEREPLCAQCGSEALPRSCSVCGLRIASPRRDGLLFGRAVDRALLGRYLRPLRYTGQDQRVVVRAAGYAEAPVQLVAEHWTLVIMPVRNPAIVGPAFGEVA